MAWHPDWERKRKEQIERIVSEIREDLLNSQTYCARPEVLVRVKDGEVERRGKIWHIEIDMKLPLGIIELSKLLELPDHLRQPLLVVLRLQKATSSQVA